MFEMKKRHTTLLLILGLYAAIALFVEYTHNHEMDSIFHDDCPACLWETQLRNKDTITPLLLNSVTNPLKAGLFQTIFYESADPQQTFLSVYACRAPPYS